MLGVVPTPSNPNRPPSTTRKSRLGWIQYQRIQGPGYRLVPQKSQRLVQMKGQMIQGEKPFSSWIDQGALSRSGMP